MYVRLKEKRGAILSDRRGKYLLVAPRKFGSIKYVGICNKKPCNAFSTVFSSSFYFFLNLFVSLWLTSCTEILEHVKIFGCLSWDSVYRLAFHSIYGITVSIDRLKINPSWYFCISYYNLIHDAPNSCWILTPPTPTPRSSHEEAKFYTKLWYADLLFLISEKLWVVLCKKKNMDSYFFTPNQESTYK